MNQHDSLPFGTAHFSRPSIQPTPGETNKPLRIYTYIWCRWPDSNRHSFRHCPLKTACLPIPPHRLFVLGTVSYSPGTAGRSSSAFPIEVSSSGAGAISNKTSSSIINSIDSSEPVARFPSTTVFSRRLGATSTLRFR